MDRPQRDVASWQLSNSTPSRSLRLATLLMSHLPHSQIGPYRIEGQLGRGGMGVVLKGIDSTLEREVAIKLMSETLAHERDVVERFLREARAMAKISDTHVVQVYGVDTFEGRPYIAMEFIRGSDLQQVLKTQGRQSPAAAVAFVLAAAKGLHAAHEVGLIHRDIKPANLLVNQKGVVKVTDFGIALAHHEAAKRLTGTGNIVGTPGYLAPEVCLGNPADARSDLYGLGVVLFELICGSPPFVGDTPLSIMMQVVEQEPPDVRALVQNVDAELAEIISSLLVKAPAARLQSCAELIQRLSHWQLVTAPGMRTPSDPLLAIAPYGTAATATAAQARRNSLSKPRLSLLAESRLPMWFFAGCVLAFALSAAVQIWLMQLMYGSLDAVAGGSFSYALDQLKFRGLVGAGVSVIAYVAFALWFLRTHGYLTEVRGLAWPQNSKLALILWTLPPLSCYFSWRVWQQLKRAAQALPGPEAAPEKSGSTALGLWWLCFFGSLALTLTALYLFPYPPAAAPVNTYVLTIELFARGLWLVASALTLWLMFRISLDVSRLGR